MQTEEIKLKISPDLAERFRNATPEQQRKALEGALRAAEETIHYALMSGEEAAREFQQLSQRMGAYANGATCAGQAQPSLVAQALDGVGGGGFDGVVAHRPDRDEDGQAAG